MNYQTTPTPKADHAAIDIDILCAADIKPERIIWLMPNYVARKKLNVLAGAAGGGKSTIAYGFAAIVSSGGTWPDGTVAKEEKVLIWSGEDDANDTIIPRLMAAGANLKNIGIISKATSGGEKRPFDPSTDMPALQKYIEANEIALLILDPIVSSIGAKVNSHNNAETRQGLQPVVDLAIAANCAVLGIHHLSKGTAGRDPSERLNGSLAFNAVARVVLIAAKNREGEDPPRLLMRAKSNNGPDGGGFGYDIAVAPLYERPDIETSKIVWKGPIEGSARDLMDAAEAIDKAGGKDTALGGAMTWLVQALTAGPRVASEITEEARAAGFTKTTLRRAVAELNIAKSKDGFNGPWMWSIRVHDGRL